ncbi:hypothetical protein LARI1_G005472 [Lachnellula arida]|uniref:Uncharacterized protein n=1 Tax=Lachnellula arida TaxID=1316785 RepID=A0A8T9BHW3_9HELO|nr:hypothetical protein LARI1_G005472 [Lachnellula arida]
MPPKSKARAFRNTPAQAPVPSKNEPPEPFSRPTSKLEPFLSTLSTNHIYITHIDTKPVDFKRKIFLVPVLMNVAIVGLILWRIKYILPWYMKICWSLMAGARNETSLDTAWMSYNDIAKEILRRSMSFVLDLMIYVFIWPWPRAFFTGRAAGNPVLWRFIVGFNREEIIVRRSRRWFQAGLDMLEEGSEQDLVLRTVRQAVDPMWMNEKTGYLMLSKEWDLDWKLMVTATKLCDKKKMDMKDFKPTIFIHDKTFGWMTIESAVASGTAKEEEGRRKIVAFKDELTVMGKENLFFRWIELVQFESSQPGGFGPERQEDTMIKAKKITCYAAPFSPSANYDGNRKSITLTLNTRNPSNPIINVD